MRIVLLASCALAAPALAQDTTTRRDTALLAPTVVTVTRSSQTLEGAPLAVGVATRGEIQRGRPGLALDEALAIIPGVQVDNRFNYALGERISVRGIGARAQFGVRGVRVILDGIPMTTADGQTTLNNVDVSGLSRVEVIRGPASALYGNAAGGVLQLETDRAADLTSRPIGGELRVAGGSHGMVRSTASLAGMRPGLDFTAGVSRLRYGGFRQWSDARNDHANVRFNRGLAGGEVALVANIADYDSKNPGGLSRALLAANRDTIAPANMVGRTGEEGSQAQIGGIWKRPVSGADVTLAVHGAQRSIDNPIPGTIVAVDRRAGGARLSVDAERESWGHARIGGGVELQLQDDDRRNFANNGGARGATTLDQRERVTNTSVFAQAAADLAPRLSLTTGLRYDRIAFTADDRLVSGTNPDDSGEREMSSVSPSIGVVLRVANRFRLYGNVGTSFETPTTSELANQESGAGGLNPALKPQRALSTEAGTKGTFVFAGLLGAYDLALYSARLRDALIPFQNTAGRTYYRNAASTTNRGVELSGTLALPAGVSMRAAFTHTDARFDEYTVTTGTGTTVYDGNRVPGVAANRVEGTLSGQAGMAYLDLDARAYSSVPVNDANADRAEGYVLWGIRAGARELSIAGLRLAPHAAVQNLFGRDYITSVTVNAFGSRFFEPGPGRTWSAGLTLGF